MTCPLSSWSICWRCTWPINGEIHVTPSYCNALAQNQQTLTHCMQHSRITSKKTPAVPKEAPAAEKLVVSEKVAATEKVVSKAEASLESEQKPEVKEKRDKKSRKDKKKKHRSKKDKRRDDFAEKEDSSIPHASPENLEEAVGRHVARYFSGSSDAEKSNPKMDRYIDKAMQKSMAKYVLKCAERNHRGKC